MTLAAGRVKELQFFLIDAAKRYVATSDAGLSGAGELLSSAAALDYVLLVSSERPGELVDDANPIAAGCRETTLRAATAALDLIDFILVAPADVFEDFMERHVRVGRIFETFRSLRETDVLSGGDIAFRIVTSASDLLERRAG
jgi:hypothetical protein